MSTTDSSGDTTATVRVTDPTQGELHVHTAPDARPGEDTLAQHWIAHLDRHDLGGSTHFEGCEFHHEWCAIRKLAEAVIGQAHVIEAMKAHRRETTP